MQIRWISILVLQITEEGGFVLTLDFTGKCHLILRKRGDLMKTTKKKVLSTALHVYALGLTQTLLIIKINFPC